MAPAPEPLDSAHRHSSKPCVSVLMPAYNAVRFIDRAIRSLLAQSLTNWELIVVDDGSTDGTAEIAQGFQDPRISVIRQANRGEAAARNAALRSAAGEFVAFLDADDAFLPEHLHTLSAHLSDHPRFIGAYTDGYYVTGDDTRLRRISTRRRAHGSGRLFDQVLLASDVIAPPLCVMLRRQTLCQRQLSFDEQIGLGTDWDFFTRVSDVGLIAYLEQPTCLYRLHGDNMTIQTSGPARLRGVAACRSKAIRMPSFAACPEPVRAAVFYDLLVNALAGLPERQQDVVAWPQFNALTAVERARLLRLMASGAILRNGNDPVPATWLARSARLNPGDARARLLLACYRASPRVCRAVLRLRTANQRRSSASRPYADLDV